MSQGAEAAIGGLPNGPAAVVPRRIWRWGPPATVVALAGALVFIIFAVFAFLCVQGYGTTIDMAKAKAQTAADIVADDVDSVIDGARAVLLLAGASTSTPPGALDAAAKGLDTGASVGLYDAQGNAVAGAVPANLPPSLAGSPALAALASGTDFVILPQGKDATTGAATIEVAARNGAGVALLSMPASILERFWAPQKLGQDSTVNVHLENGDMVGRYPALAAPANAGNSPNWPLIAANGSGTYSTVSPIDHVTRIVGFRHIDDLGIVVFATVSQDAAMAGLWTSIIIVTWLLVPFALALVAGSLITAGLLRRSARTQASLAAAVAHNEVLFREIHHRVKNNLQSVGSLLQMQPIPREIKADMGQRIAAMSAVHEHIYRSNNFSTVMVKSYLETLIENIRAGGDPRVKVVEQIEDLPVDKDAATPLGLIVNEVVANAFKHAFPDGREGMITVSLTRQDASSGRLVVSDNGVGFDPAVPAKGIGQRLIKALTAQLGGTSEMSSANGATFSLVFPLAKDATAPA